MMDSRKAPSSNPFSPVSSAPAPSSTGVGVADSGAGGGTGSGPDDPEVTWWCRILIRVIASIVGAVAFALGVMACVSITPLCIVAGILQMISAFVLLVFEAPFCCQFIEITKPIALFAERRSFLQKAFIYGAIAIPPVFMCFGPSTIVGSGLIFAIGVVYGLMSLGRKADRGTMLARASGEEDKIEIVPHDQLKH